MMISWSGPSIYIPGLLMTNDAPLGADSPAPATEISQMSFGDILKKVYDRTNLALHVIDAGTASGTYGSNLDAQQIIQHVYDPSHNALRIVEVTGGALTDTGKLDFQQIFKKVYDPTMEALRVVVEPSVIALNAHLDAETILERYFDHPNSALRVSASGVVSANLGTHLDWQQIWKKTLDATNGWLKVVE